MSGRETFSKSVVQRVQALVDPKVSESRQLSAFAKVNLRLKVEGRRPDGYHLLSMLNCSTSLCDTLTISLRAEKNFHVDITPEGILSPGEGENLVTKAFRAFWREFGFDEPPCGFDCAIEKRIPIGGGLGGGSSDAGAMLRFLDDCFRSGLCESLELSPHDFAARVKRAALAVGADVPYAYVGGLCLVRGIGEEVTPLSDRFVWGGKVLLLVPSSPMPTVRFYEEFRKARPDISHEVDTALKEFVEEERGDLLSLVENDFEHVVCNLLPDVREGLRVAREVFGRGTALTGSGSVFFSLIPPGDEGKVSELSARLNGLGIRSYITSLSNG